FDSSARFELLLAAGDFVLPAIATTSVIILLLIVVIGVVISSVVGGLLEVNAESSS
ncbi:hypothetical protein DXG03_004636, partial [Asterophora parasitica]